MVNPESSLEIIWCNARGFVSDHVEQSSEWLVTSSEFRKMSSELFVLSSDLLVLGKDFVSKLDELQPG